MHPITTNHALNYYYTCARSKLSVKLCIDAIYLMGIYGGCMYIVVPNIKSVASTMWPRTLYTYFTNYWCFSHAISLKKYDCYIAIVAHTVQIVYWHRGPVLLYMCPKAQQKEKFTLHCIGIYVPETTMDYIIHIYANYLMCVWGICLYMCQIWSHWNQQCDQEQCGQMKTTSLPPTTLTAPYDYIGWLGLWAILAKNHGLSEYSFL